MIIKGEREMASTRLTRQKQEFKRFLEVNRESEMTVAEMAEKLKENGSDMGIATVYRAVRRLEKEGLLVKTVSNGAGSTARYRYSSGDENIRSIHRVFCLSCGKAMDLSYNFTDKLEKSVSEVTGYSLCDHQIMFYGLCPDCK